jgi:hypothetical protein
VLCSISLLTGTEIFWKISFGSAALGLSVALFGLFR